VARGQARHARRVTARTTTAGEPVSRASPAAGGSGSRTPALKPRAMRSAASPPPTGPCPKGRTHGTAPAGVLLPAKAQLMRAPPAGPGLPEGLQPGGTRHVTGTTTAAQASPVAGDLHRQPMPPPASGVSAVPRDRWRASQHYSCPHCSCPRSASRRRGPGRGQGLPGTSSAHPVPGPAVPHRPASRVLAVLAQAPRQALSAPYQPPLTRGRGHYLAEPTRCWPGWSAPCRNRLRAGSVSLPATGRNQLPGVSYVPIACYGLTPRCREVKR